MIIPTTLDIIMTLFSIVKIMNIMTIMIKILRIVTKTFGFKMMNNILYVCIIRPCNCSFRTHTIRFSITLRVLHFFSMFSLCVAFLLVLTLLSRTCLKSSTHSKWRGGGVLCIPRNGSQYVLIDNS